jgi:hypothetical protein
MVLIKISPCLDKFGVSLAGEIFENSTGSDILLIKYNSNGDTVWTRRYNSLNNADEFPQGIVVDSIGNVYVTGYTGIGFGATKILLLKYSPAGNLIWEKLYAEPGNSSQIPSDIKLDRQGNIYLAGGYWIGSQAVNGITIKYNTSGDTIWTRRKITNGYEYNENHIAIDSNNNVLIGGLKIFLQFNMHSFMALKYDASGNELWTALTPRPAFIGTQGIAADANGNCYLIGAAADYK